jgi:hypothetical protein
MHLWGFSLGKQGHTVGDDSGGSIAMSNISLFTERVAEYHGQDSEFVLAYAASCRVCSRQRLALCLPLTKD